MIGEAAIGIQISAALSVGTQRFQNFIDIESTCAIAGIYNDAEAFQRLVFTCSGTDLICQDLSVNIHKFAVYKCTSCQTGSFITASIGKDLLDVSFFETALSGKELKAVSVEGQMTGGDHDRTVKLVGFCNSGHEHSGGTCHTKVGNIQTCLHHCIANPVTQSLTGQA